MEIKTCEQYVLRELENAHKELEAANKAYIELNKSFNELLKHRDKVLCDFKDLQDLICDIAAIRTSDTQMSYISFNSIYESWDAEQFEALNELVPNLKQISDSDV